MASLKRNNLIQKLLSNTLIFAIGNFSTKLMYFILLPLYTYTLTTEQYGIIDVITSTVDLLLPLLTICIYEAVLRYTLENYHSEEILALSIRITLLSLVVVGCISPILLNILEIKEYWIFFLVTFATSSIKNIFFYYARGKKQVLLSVGCGLANVIFLTIFNIVFLLILKKSVVGYYISSISADVIVIVFLGINLKVKLIDFIKKCDKGLKKEVFHYVVPMVANQMCWWVNYTLDKYILIFFHGIALSGVYAVAYKIPGILNTTMGVFLQAWQLSAVEEHNEGRDENFGKLYMVYFNVAAFVCLVLILICEFVAHFLFAKDFYNGWRYVPILLIALFFHTNAAFLGSVFTTTKHTNILFYSTLIGAIINTVFNLCFIPKFGAYGASVATLLSYGVIWFVRYWKTGKEITFRVSNYKQVLLISILVIAMLSKLLIENFYLSIIINAVALGIMLVMNYNTIKKLIYIIVKLKFSKNS